VSLLGKAWRVRRAQGLQVVPDVRTASPPGLRALPRVAPTPCAEGCTACVDACGPGAISLAPVRLDLGRCTFTGDCVPVCPVGKLSFTNDHRTATTSREGLVVGEGRALEPARVSERLAALFGRSLRLRQVSAGGCNGCELELGALGNVNFDLQRYGIEWVASPRHADGLVLTGPITKSMAEPLRLCWDATPDPKFLVVVGACAISGGAFHDSDVLDRAFLGQTPPTLYVPGCPPHPLTIACGLLDLLGRAS
jgi:Ni,Fe-hydrogenase III small subunit/ferredoxin